MGIYIKGMEMPTGRPVCIIIDPAGQVRRYDLNNDRYVDDELFEAVPVPPHGRLIDADEFCTEHRSLKLLGRVGIRRFNWHVAAAAFVEDAPTIIPAESEETE